MTISARLRAGIALFATTIALVAGFLISIRIGPWAIEMGNILQIVFGQLSGASGLADDPSVAIIWHGRLPRALTGALVGFALGAAGAIMQGIFKNPMASPGIIGTSSGAALGAVIALYFGLSAGNIYIVPLFSIAVAFGSLFVVLGIATTGGLTSRYTLLLAGIAFNAIFTALTSIVIILSTEQFEMAQKVVGWLMGDLNNRSWEHVHIIVLVSVVGILGAMLYARDLNIIMVSEELAKNFGVNVVWARNMLLFFAALLTGGAISVAGGIGFVGLISPHVMRSFVGSDNRVLIPAAGLLGSTLVIYSDCLVRVLGAGGLRIGVLTALLGGPFFLYLIIRDRRKYVYF